MMARISTGSTMSDPKTADAPAPPPSDAGDSLTPESGETVARVAEDDAATAAGEPEIDLAEARVEAAAAEARELAGAREEAQRTRDQLLRVAADFDNFRKRTKREMEDARRRAQQSAVKELLPVFDNLERATSHLEPSVDEATARSLVEGLRMVVRQFIDTLGKLGIRRTEAVGQPFDPTVHESIQHLCSSEHPAGTVITEVQPGYVMGGELLRPALVVVSKGPDPAPAPPAAEEEERPTVPDAVASPAPGGSGDGTAAPQEGSPPGGSSD
jgi:molecular chaperone GrpE